MGTNFYWRSKCCLMCERYDEHHIGKRSSGWQFCFRGWQGEKFSANSWAEWKAHILSGGAVYDEYGTEFMPHEFFKLVEDTIIPGAKNHYDYTLTEKLYTTVGPIQAKDSEGWSFSYGEFC